MAKYNLKEKKEKPATYRTAIKPEIIDNIYEQILRKMIVEKKYRDPNYSAKQLAAEIQTNTRYISAAVSLRFQMNYAELVSEYRIRDAVSMLTDKRSRDLSMGEVALACGFANRQSFYSSFYRIQGKTPKHFRDEFFARLKQPKNPSPKKDL
ncbi:MAG: helix-turn-helix domain-containing protein [Bacteroidales bacterium]|nr:helix-turn-helix domain-containing protein [Bacteroidales bacterium]